MSASTEIPDIVGGITDAIGLNRLWQTDQQADSQRRRSEQAEKSADEEARRTNQKDKNDSGDVAPASISKEREKTQLHADVDHDVEIHGVPRRRTPPDPSLDEGKGYTWPTPSSLNDNQPKKKYDSETT